MKQTINRYQFIDAFDIRPDNFSREALDLLFDYFEEYEDGTGEEVELDVIAICCDYNEMTTDDIIREYRIDASECDGDDERDELVRDYLEENTTLVGKTSDGFVFANF